jgi:iron complex outermembrane receptor protein
VIGQSFISDIIGTSTSPDVKGNRTVSSAYGELAIPLVSPEMNFPAHQPARRSARGPRRALLRLRQRREAESRRRPRHHARPSPPRFVVAGLPRPEPRADQRHPGEPLEQPSGLHLLRSRPARRAASPSFNACARSRATQAIRAGNPDLKPETSNSLSYGAVLEPRFIPERFGRFTFTADIWRIKQEGIIGVFGEGNAVILDYYLRVTGSSNPKVKRAVPSPEDIAALRGHRPPARGRRHLGRRPVREPASAGSEGPTWAPSTASTPSASATSTSTWTSPT